MIKHIVTASVLLISVHGAAHANPLVAGPVAQAAAGAVAGSEAEAGAGASSSGSVSNKGGDTNAYGGAIGQAPTAVGNGPCGKGNKLAFGALEWTDYSDKCFNYSLAIEAERAGQYERANAWVRRADGIE